MEFVGIILFLAVSALLSIVNRAAEKKKAQERAERRAHTAQETMGEHIPTARRKGAVLRPTQRVPQAHEVEDTIRRLMGMETDGSPAAENVDDERDWQPVPPPTRRDVPRQQQQVHAPRPSQPQAHRNPPAFPRQMHQPQRQPLQQPRRPQQQLPPQSARPERQRPARTPAELMGQQQQRRRVTEEITPEEMEQRAREQQWRQEMERRKKVQAAQEAAQRPKELPRQRPHMVRSGGGLFRGHGDLRRAIILSEVLNPPRALREMDDRV